MIANANTVIQPIIAAILTYVSTLWAGEADPLWPHVVLLSLAVLASIAVGGGIIFERPKYSASVHRVAFWLVVVGIAIEAVCTIFLFITDERISDAQQSTIRTQNEEIIALDKKLAPRSLTQEQQSALVSAAEPFAAQQYTLSVAVGSEPAALLCQIDAALIKAKWVRHSPIDFLHTKPCNQDWEVGVNLTSDVHIRGSKDAALFTRQAILSLAEVLQGADIATRVETDPTMTDPAMAAILIGAKL